MMTSSWDIKGKVCLVTGANSGIGRETALQLVQLGAGRVILACRNLEAGEEAVKYIRQEAAITDDEEAKRRVALRKLDLASLESVRKFAKQINEEEQNLHVLVNNAGIVLMKSTEISYTEDGLEMHFGTNHLGHFLLTNLLLDLLKRSAPSRIVVVSSIAYSICWWNSGGFPLDNANFEQGGYSGFKAYSQSKLANIHFARTLDQKLNGNGPSGVTVYSLHPGMVRTSVARGVTFSLWKRILLYPIRLVLVNAQQGAATSIHCATQPGIEEHSGDYFSNCAVRGVWGFAKDEAVGEKLWKLSEELIAEPPGKSTK